MALARFIEMKLPEFLLFMLLIDIGRIKPAEA
jgi:hypothetical protein